MTETMEISALTQLLLDESLRASNGAFIVVEGIDASGKSSLCEQLALEITARYDVETKVDNEFSDGFIGRFIRRNMNTSNLTDNELQLLALFDRLHHITKLDGIAQHVTSVPGTFLICDRGWMSTLAYSLASYDNDINCEHMQLILGVSGMVSDLSIVPDLTILIDVPVDIAVNRIMERDKIDRYEKKETLTKVDKGYRQLVRYMGLMEGPVRDDMTERFIMVDGTQTLQDMVDNVIDQMERLGMFITHKRR